MGFGTVEGSVFIMTGKDHSLFSVGVRGGCSSLEVQGSPTTQRTPLHKMPLVPHGQMCSEPSRGSGYVAAGDELGLYWQGGRGKWHGRWASNCRVCHRALSPHHALGLCCHVKLFGINL